MISVSTGPGAMTLTVIPYGAKLAGTALTHPDHGRLGGGVHALENAPPPPNAVIEDVLTDAADATRDHPRRGRLKHEI